MKSARICLEDYFPYFLGVIANRWTATSSRAYLRKYKIGIGEWRVLASIHSFGQASSNEVVDQISMDASAVSRSAAKLEDAGHISPVPGKYTGRTKPYALTATGIALYAEVRKLALAREDLLLGGLTAAERRSLLELMRKVHRRLDRI